MTTRKHDVIVQRGMTKNTLEVFADLAAEDVINQVEGVLRVRSAKGFPHFVVVDPRYDNSDVATDIERAIKGALLLQQWACQEPSGEERASEGTRND